jgi:hypothetical protein
MKQDGRIVLRSDDYQDVNLGFEKITIGNESKYIKYVTRDEVEEFYDRKIYAKYSNYIFEVIDEKDDKILISTMVGNYHDWIDLGMECVDKGVYQMWIDKDSAEITIKTEQRG